MLLAYLWHLDSNSQVLEGQSQKINPLKLYISNVFRPIFFKLGRNDLTMQLGHNAQVRHHLLQGQGHSESKTKEIVRTA